MIFRRKECESALPASAATAVRTKISAEHNRGVSAHAMKRPDAIALSFGETSLSYSTLDARTSRLACAMNRLGVREGDRVISLQTTSIELFEVSVAVAKMEAVLVPLAPKLRPDHLATAVSDVRPALVVAGDGLWSELCSRTSALDGIKALLIVDPDGPRHCRFVAGVREEYEASLAAAGVKIEPWIATRTARLAIYHPSASPGESGGLHLVLDNAEAIERVQEIHIDRWSWNESEVYLLCSGAYHPGPGGWAQTALQVGAHTVVMPSWDPIQWLATVESRRVTRCFMNPRHFKGLLDVPDEVWNRYNLSSLKMVVHGGTRCPAAVKMRIIERLAPAEVWEIFGTVDTFVSRISSAEWLERPGSVGLPEQDVTVTVVNGDGRPLPAGRTGMICWSATRRGSSSPQTSRVPSTCWSAHVGHLDEDGYLFVTDKSPDGVRRGNAMVYPWEVEEVIHGHREVDDCVVFGADVVDGKQRLVAVVQAPLDLDVETIATHCRLYLNQERFPDEIVLTRCIERDDIGKVSRVSLAIAYQHRTGIFAPGADSRRIGGSPGQHAEGGSGDARRSEPVTGANAGPIADLDGASVAD